MFVDVCRLHVVCIMIRYAHPMIMRLGITALKLYVQSFARNYPTKGYTLHFAVGCHKETNSVHLVD